MDIKRQSQDRQLAQRDERLQSLGAERDTLRKRLDQQRKDTAGLKERLAAADQQIKALTRDSASLKTLTNTYEAKLAKLAGTNRARQDEISQLSAKQAAQTEKLAQLKQALKESEARSAASQSALDSAMKARRLQTKAMTQLKSEHQTTSQELDKLRADYQAKVAELSAVLAKLETANRSQAKLTDSYDQLKAQYNRLVRPARSPKGRYVVEVRYTKSAGHPDIRMRVPTDTSFHSVDRSALESRLDKLVKAHPEGLYVKVIFPKNSGLSYTEAWQFTNALHAKYDYYYRDHPPSDADTAP
jgi:predicted  nucleic acid-binding Zn-ribbon protein